MAGGVGHMLLDPGDFFPEESNPLLQLIDREGPQVFLGELCQGTLRAAGKEVVVVHG